MAEINEIWIACRIGEDGAGIVEYAGFFPSKDAARKSVGDRDGFEFLVFPSLHPDNRVIIPR